MPNNIIEVRGVSRTYRKGPTALRNVDLDAVEGSRLALLGVNGAGKSTLIRILCTLSRADSGSVRVDGYAADAGAPALRRLIGVALQDAQLDPEESPRSQLSFQGRLYGMSARAAAARSEELLARFSLAGVADRKAKELSGGNRRRLHVAMALVHGPRILFLDEPTVGMDPGIRSEFWSEIRRLNGEEGMTVLFSTQYLAEAEHHAQELAVIDSGSVAYRGTMGDFLAANAGPGDDLESCFVDFIDGRRAKEAIGA